MLIRPKIPIAIRKLLKSTRFWQDNFIILREFKHFRAIAIIALTCTLRLFRIHGVKCSLSYVLSHKSNGLLSR